MFSAYDLKKIIPRAVFALVAVNLSWGLMELFINGIQVLGDGAQGLILAPFQQAKVLGVQLGAGGELAFAAIIGAAAGAAAIGIIPVVGVAVSGLFGLLFAFGIIMLRKIMLIGLIIIAPVAIALSVFPQTESWAKKWWEWFSKLLLMYPFIMAFFGISEVAAGIISRTNATNEFEKIIYQLGAVVILILPYFLVGKALSLAGGAIGKVAGMVNNKDKGLIDKTKKWEGAKVAERRYDASRGQRYGGRNFVTRGLNTGLRSVRHPSSAVGKQEDRNARILSMVQQNADTTESRHEGAKTMTKDERAVLSMISDESEATDAINSIVKRRVQEQGLTGTAATAFEDTERAKLNVAYKSGKDKVGGSVDSGTQLYSLQKAVAEGAISPQQAEESASRLAGKLATRGGQKDNLASTLHSQLDVAASSAGQLAGSVTAAATVRRAASTTPGASPPPPPIDHTAIERVYRGPAAYSSDKLAELQPEALEQVISSKTQKIGEKVRDIHMLGLSPAEEKKRVDEVAQHRADLLLTRAAAAKAGKQNLVNQTSKAIADIDSMVATVPTIVATVKSDSDQQATDRFKPI